MIYIAGYGHSGTTILDLILGNHPQIRSLGEVSNLFEFISEDRACSCGQTLENCGIWSNVLREIEAIGDRSWTEINNISRMVENGKVRDAPSISTYKKIWSHVVKSVSSEDREIKYVVDSSKTTYNNRYRVQILNGVTETKIIYVIRDPRAVLWSALRKKKRMKSANTNWKSMVVARTLFGWLYSNMIALKLRKDESYSVLTVNYESLVKNVEFELERISRHLSVDFKGLIESVKVNGIQTGHNHLIGGNRLKKSDSIYLQHDDEFLRKIPFYYRLMVAPLFPLYKKILSIQ